MEATILAGVIFLGVIIAQGVHQVVLMRQIARLNRRDREFRLFLDRRITNDGLQLVHWPGDQG